MTYCIGVVGKKGCENIDKMNYERAVNEPSKESAKKWFKRPAYDIKRSGASGTSGNDGERAEEGISESVS